MLKHTTLWLAALLAMLGSFCGTRTCWAAEPAKTPPAAAELSPAETDAKIAALIQQLGDKEYTVRQRAQQELTRQGFAAFDALTEAEGNDDIEIAAQAKYLVRLIRVDWTQESDPPQIRQILKDYDQQTETMRSARILDLANLSNDLGVEWLCRLARFEQSPILSKQAAMTIIARPQSEPVALQKRAKVILRSLDRSHGPAARWLKAYALTQTDPATAFAEWVKLTNEEQQTLEQFPQQSQHEFVTKLLRQQIEVLDQLSRGEEALAVLRKMVSLERGDEQSLTELVDWLVRRKAWGVVDEVAKKFAAVFDTNAVLLYTLAQARLTSGDEKQAEETAQRAAKLKGDHLTVAQTLAARGMTKWSDQEYRQVIANGKDSPEAIYARLLLCESLHEREDDLAAAEVLKGVVDAMEKGDRNVNTIVARLRRDPGEVKARTFFFYSAHHHQLKEYDKEKEYLDKAIAENSSDADVLIALYHWPNLMAEEKAKTVKLIETAVQEQRNAIEEAPDEPISYNQLAWLVANTTGDFDEAIRMSHKSIELKRAGGYLDTLGHCYAAKGDYENAVKYQTEAKELDPFSEAIGRKLIVFQKALDEKNKSQQK